MLLLIRHQLVKDKMNDLMWCVQAKEFTPARSPNTLSGIEVAFFNSFTCFPSKPFHKRSVQQGEKGRNGSDGKRSHYSWGWKAKKNLNDIEFTFVQGNLSSDSILGGGTFEVRLRISHIPLGHNCFIYTHTWRVRLLMQPRWRLQNNEEETA